MDIFNNFLVNGVCGVPGTASGRLVIWGEQSSSVFQSGDIILVLPDSSCEVPLQYISLAGGIISCCHTSYSHLVSASQAFNIPCVIGAKFSFLPREFQRVFMNAQNRFVTLDIETPTGICALNNDDTLRNIALALSYPHNKPLAHLYGINEIEEYKDMISGFFVDANILAYMSNIPLLDIVENITKICNQTDIKVYYRFSQNPSKHAEGHLEKECEFVSLLVQTGINLSLFFPNATCYDDAKKFRDFVSVRFAEHLPIRTGTMIENKCLLEELELILRDHLIDFAVVGMNDLLSSILNIERDNAVNEDSFALDNPNVFSILKSISQKCNRFSVPYYISYPKFKKFIDDFALLRKAGYMQFFGSLSLFRVLRLYGLSGYEE